MKIQKINILTALFIFSAHWLTAQFVTNHNTIFQTNLTIPQVGVTFTDPNFGTPVIRMTNARSQAVSGYFPDYSKRQAWNSDESMIMLRSANGAVHIFNGQNYQYIKTLTDIQGVQDIFWHPTNPLLIYYILDNMFYTLNVQTLQSNLLFTFTNYSYVTTRAEGNMSNDGHYIALCGYDINYNTLDFFVFDVLANTIHSTFAVNGNVTDFDWISISPLGNYVIVDYATDVVAPYNGVEVYDKDFNFLWRKPLGAGHSDYGLDYNGEEVLIMDFYDVDSNFMYINKYLLSNGMTTHLLSVSPDFDLHESCRAMSRIGWVYISTFDFVGRLTDDSLSWLPFEDEIFAVKMDGSGDVQRYAHHHSKRYSLSTPNSDSSVYFAEPHATINKNGTRILFGSNWRLNIAQDTSVDAYIVDLNNMLNAIKRDIPSDNPTFRIYPNPATDKLNVVSDKIYRDAVLKIYDALGKIVSEAAIRNFLTSVPVSALPMGLYLYQISDSDGKILDEGKFLKE